MVDLALVHLWGQLVSAVRWNPTRSLATFAYDPDFVKSGLDVAP
jgi:serine/threonine-protein kinase HipA